MTYRIANLIITEVVTPLGMALKPAYAALQSDPERLRVAFEKSLSVVAAFILPTGIFLLLTADLIVPVLLGTKWNAIIPILPIFVLGAIFQGIEGISFAFFIGTGSPHKDFYLALTKAISLMACIYPFFLLAGLKGIAWAVTISTISRFFVFVIQLYPLIDIRQFVIRELFLVSFCTVIMGIALLVESVFMPATWWSVVVITCSAILVYAISIWLCIDKRTHLVTIKVMLQDQLRSIKSSTLAIFDSLKSRKNKHSKSRH
jgi:PST family polysaccharide transporter